VAWTDEAARDGIGLPPTGTSSCDEPTLLPPQSQKFFDGVNLLSTTVLSNGKMPAVMNPFLMLCSDKAFFKANETQWAKISFVAF
jgi:hypothetical protein